MPRKKTPPTPLKGTPRPNTEVYKVTAPKTRSPEQKRKTSSAMRPRRRKS